jgi:tetratricopeptide (TPR) repeat protein
MPEIESLEQTRKILRGLLFVVIGVIVSDLPFAFAEESRTPEHLNALITEGIDFTLRQEYDRADSVFRIVVDYYPNHPLGYLYRAAVMETKSMDYLDPLDFTTFDSLLAVAKSEAEKIVETSPSSPIGYYYRGSAIGYDAYARVDAGNWLSGIVKGLSAASDFKKSVELDSSFYDSYVGVGTYYYWKSRKAEILNWALGDRRAEGVRLLEIAVEKAEQNKYAALSALSAIYLDSGQFNLSIQCARRALDRYPENRIFLWGLAAAQEQSEDYTDAVQTYQHLLTNILNAKISNPYNEILCRINYVKARLALKQSQGLNSQIDAILAYEHYVFPENLATRAKNKFEQARNIRAQLAVE